MIGARACAPLAAALVAATVAAAVTLGPMLAAAAVPLLPPALGPGVFVLAVFGPMLVVAVLACRLDRRSACPRGGRPLRSLGLGAALGAAALVIAAGLAALGGAARWQDGAAAGAAVTLGAGLVLFQCTAEEALFRGWLQPVLASAWGGWPGLVATAALFAALHALAGATGALEFVNIFLAGLLFGQLRARSGGLVAPVAAHWAWNWTERHGLGLDPNPGIAGLGAVVDLDLAGRALWSGGAAGLNGSAATTVALAAALLVAQALFMPQVSPPSRAPRRSGLALR